MEIQATRRCGDAATREEGKSVVTSFRVSASRKGTFLFSSHNNIGNVPFSAGVPFLPAARTRFRVLGRSARLVSLAILLVLGPGLFPARAAAATQEDVFKSIQENVGEKTDFDSRPVLLLLVGGGSVLLLLALMGRRSKKAAIPKALNHPGRLLKEVLKEVPLNPAEMRQLKALAENVQRQTGEPASPLSLLLCPSLLAKSLKSGAPRIDRKTVAQVVKKMGLNEVHESKR